MSMYLLLTRITITIITGRGSGRVHINAGHCRSSCSAKNSESAGRKQFLARSRKVKCRERGRSRYMLLMPCSNVSTCIVIILLQYINMYSDIGQKSNTMIFSDRPADVNALLAQAATVIKGVPQLPISSTSSDDQN